jgi:hypothetical protein
MNWYFLKNVMNKYKIVFNHTKVTKITRGNQLGFLELYNIKKIVTIQPIDNFQLAPALAGGIVMNVNWL